MGWYLVSDGNNNRTRTSRVLEAFQHRGAPFRLNHLMSRSRLNDTLKHLTLTNKDPPAYKDRFHFIQQLIFAWNENIQLNFQSGWALCLDESMSTWTN
jgi:hypothetical protein